MTADREDVIHRSDQAIIDVAVASAVPHALEGGKRYAVAVPAGGDVKELNLDLDEYRNRPRRLKGETVVRDEQSLILLCTELGTKVAGQKAGEGVTTRVYADAADRSVVAVLNDDVDSTNPGWRDRRVRLVLAHTPEWQRWAALDGKLMSQQAFAEHVEACLDDIREPDAASMLEIAQTIEATTNVDFRSQVRLTSGQRQFTYAENTDARAGSGGTLTVPEQFVLGLTPWAGRDAKPFRVEARLRYRITPGGLTLGYKLIDTERILRTAFEEDVVKPIREAGLTIVNGTP